MATQLSLRRQVVQRGAETELIHAHAAEPTALPRMLMGRQPRMWLSSITRQMLWSASTTARLHHKALKVTRAFKATQARQQAVQVITRVLWNFLDPCQQLSGQALDVPAEHQKSIIAPQKIANGTWLVLCCSSTIFRPVQALGLSCLLHSRLVAVMTVSVKVENMLHQRSSVSFLCTC